MWWNHRNLDGDVVLPEGDIFGLQSEFHGSRRFQHPGSAEPVRSSASGGEAEDPQLKAALAALDFATEDRLVALNGFFPSLTLDYYYGIDANQYAVNGVFDPVLGRTPRNLGYAAAATLELPVWNWGANRSRFKQASLRQQQARVELTATQRELLANLQGFYQELRVAHDDLEALNKEVQLATDSLRLTTLRIRPAKPPPSRSWTRRIHC